MLTYAGLAKEVVYIYIANILPIPHIKGLTLKGPEESVSMQSKWSRMCVSHHQVWVTKG